MGYELLDHTADVGLRVWAEGPAPLFAESARAVVAVMGRAEGESVRRQDVRIEAFDLDALFVDWLSEVLFFFEARSLVPREIDIEVTEQPPVVAGTIAGPDASAFVQDGPHVKAVTFHGLKLAGGTEGWQAEFYVDV